MVPARDHPDRASAVQYGHLGNEALLKKVTAMDELEWVVEEVATARRIERFEPSLPPMFTSDPMPDFPRAKPVRSSDKAHDRLDRMR